MEKFEKLMLYLYWIRSPGRLANIFRYRPTSRKMAALFVNIGEREKQKPLVERSHFNEATAKWRCFFSELQLLCSTLFVSRENSNNLLSLVSLYHIRVINTIITVFRSAPGILLPVIAPTSLKNEKNSYYCINTIHNIAFNVMKTVIKYYYCVISHFGNVFHFVNVSWEF